MSENRKLMLVSKIKEAFADREYPGDNRIVYDNSGRDLEETEIAKAFRGKHWNEFSPPMLFAENSALSFFTVEAFCYYLPAFMLGELEDPLTMDVAGDHLIFHLTYPSSMSEAVQTQFRRRVEALSSQEKHVIREFLEYKHDIDGSKNADEALQSHWNDY